MWCPTPSEMRNDVKIKTNPTSRAYCFAFVEGLTVTVVIDQNDDERIVRVSTDHDPDTDTRPFRMVVDGSSPAPSTEALDALWQAVHDPDILTKTVSLDSNMTCLGGEDPYCCVPALNGLLRYLRSR